MAKREGSSASGPRTRSRVAKEGSKAKVENNAREAENARRLEKLPPEVWEKILENLDENDLFPLALSCRYFRQKQKELVARTRQNLPESGKPSLALKTNLKRKLLHSPASVEYLRFLSKEKVSSRFGDLRANYTRYLAAFHGHLPLLQELLKPLKALDIQISKAAG